MCHKHITKSSPNIFMPGHLNCQQTPSKQQGSMLVIALFVIIVMALLGLTLSRLLSSSSDAIIHEVYGQRALNAARAGVEEQIALAFPINGAPSCNSSSGPNMVFSAIPGLENCEVSAQCSELIVVDDAITLTYYKFISTGTCTAGDIITSRTVQVDGLQ
jgi:MSHA biogenesis protein MshP